MTGFTSPLEFFGLPTTSGDLTGALVGAGGGVFVATGAGVFTGAGVGVFVATRAGVFAGAGRAEAGFLTGVNIPATGGA